MIDIRTCCQAGLNIAMRRRYLQGGSWIVQLRIEQEHLQICQVCNPVLLANQLFGQDVTVDSTSFSLAHSQQVNQE